MARMPRAAARTSDTSSGAVSDAYKDAEKGWKWAKNSGGTSRALWGSGVLNKSLK